METNNLIEKEINLVNEEINSGILFNLLERSEISDYFYSEIEILLGINLSLQEAILIARKRFGDTLRIKKELIKISPLKQIVFYISILVLLIMYFKQMIIVYFLIDSPILINSDIDFSKPVPYYFTSMKLILITLVALIIFSSIQFGLLIFKRYKYTIKKLLFSFVLFEFVFIIVQNLLIIIHPGSTNNSISLIQHYQVTAVSGIIGLLSIILFFLLFRVVNNSLGFSTR